MREGRGDVHAFDIHETLLGKQTRQPPVAVGDRAP
jgi:hypothetical protein